MSDERRCKYCCAKLIRKYDEHLSHWNRRRFCNLSCVSKQKHVDIKIRKKAERDATIRDKPPA
jgi:hypothetical protein